MRHAIALLLLVSSASLFSQSAALPTPESVLGFKPGADFKLATYDESLDYFRKLDAATDLLTLVEIGRTSYNHPWYFALVSSAQNLANVEKYREIAYRLAHPEGLTDEEAGRLAREGKAFVHIDGGLHASEVAGAQHTIQLAYDLVSRADDPKVKPILDNVILMLWPSINPDGQNIVANWYRGNVGTPFEVAPLTELYQKYIGHDNNRDAYMANMIESREVAKVWRHWEPQIIYVHHQTAPFPTRIWLPPFAEPIAPRVPPLMSRTVNMIGMGIARSLEELLTIDVADWHVYAAEWTPGGVDFFLDDRHLRHVAQSPAYPMQVLLNIYELPEPDQSPREAPATFTVDWFRGWRKSGP